MVYNNNRKLNSCMNTLRGVSERFHISIRNQHKLKRELSREKKRATFIKDLKNGKFQPRSIGEINEQMNKFIEINKILQQDPSVGWRSILDDFCDIFTEQRVIYVWRQTNIINSLYQVFEQELDQLNLSSMASKIINYYLHFGQKEQTLLRQFEQQLLENNLIHNLCRIIQKQDNIYELVEELILIGNIASSNGFIRNKVVCQGIVPNIIKFINTPGLSEYMTANLVWISQCLVRQYDSFQQKLKYNFSRPFIDFFVQTLRKTDSPSICFDVIKGLASISSISYEVRNIYQIGAIPDIMKYAKNEASPSQSTWMLLLNLTSDPLQNITHQIAKHGGIELLQKLVKVQQIQCHIKTLIMQTIQTIIQNSRINCANIVSSKIVPHLTTQCSDPRLKIRKENLIVLQSLILNIRYPQLQYLMKRYDLVSIAVDNLVTIEEAQIKLSSINILTAIILVYSDIVNQQRMTEIMRSLNQKYSVQDVLMDIISKYQVKKVVHAAENLLQVISNNLPTE